MNVPYPPIDKTLSQSLFAQFFMSTSDHIINDTPDEVSPQPANLVQTVADITISHCCVVEDITKTKMSS